MKELINCLAEYGLSEKESDVYLAMLELGPASVQEIAKKSGVNRATTYVMIESLKRRGLMSTFDKGKKTMFVAESPERLKRLVDQQMHILKDKEDRLKNLLPSFLALYNTAGEDKPNVKFYEGEEGFKASRELYLQAKGEALSFVGIDEDVVKLSQVDEDKRLELNDILHGRTIAAFKQGITPPKINTNNWQVKKIPYEDFPFSGEIILFNDKITFTILGTVPMVFVIHSNDANKLIRAMFEFMWKHADPFSQQ